MSPYLFDAFISIEDERFEEHDGVDWKRTIGALLSFAVHRGESSYGGSTITQQIVKNLTGEDDNSGFGGALRKIKEIVRAYQVQNFLSKDQILELYLNLIPLGSTVYGVQTASIYYFNKNAKDLSLVEAAYLAGITNAPSTYNPFGETDRTERINTRVKNVLGKMHELGRITDEQYSSAMEEVNAGIKFNKGNPSQINSLPYHSESAVREIIEDLMKKNNLSRDEAKLQLYGGGYQIYTTYDPEIQGAVEEQYITKSSNWTNQYKTVTRTKEDGTKYKEEVRRESAIAIIDYRTGYVVAGTSGFGEKTEAWGQSRITSHIHSPGSSIKPIAVIGPSLEEGLITAGSVVDDIPVTYGNWSPRNDTGYDYRGLMNIRWILRVSRNIPQVKMMQRLTVTKSLKYLAAFGLDTSREQNDGLSLALGGMSYGPTVLQMAAAYATIANGGTYIDPTFYTKVTDTEGNTLIETTQETRRVLSEQNAYILQTLLKEPIGIGLTGTSKATATRARVANQDTAGKTGTTNDSKAVWFCGFTPYYAGAVWMGYDIETDGSAGGSSTTAALWGAIMNTVHKNLPASKFQEPNGLEKATICSKSGLLATDYCNCGSENEGYTYTEYFVKGTKPTEYCDVHVKANVCVVSGKLAGDNCKNVVERVFITRENSDKDKAWEKADDAKYMLPTEKCEDCKKEQGPTENNIDTNITTNQTVNNTTSGNTATNTAGNSNTVVNNTTTNTNTTNTTVNNTNNTTQNQTTSTNVVNNSNNTTANNATQNQTTSANTTTN